MNTVLIGLLLMIGANENNEEVKSVLMDYIVWTTTGKSSTDYEIFDDEVNLFYQESLNELKAASFEDYRVDVEGAAAEFPRSMSIKSMSVDNLIAKAEVADCSEDHGFSLIHHLTLVRADDQWRIQSIEIVVSDNNFKERKMNKHMVSTFNVVGVAARISNEGGSAAEEVETLWDRFWKEDIRNLIPNNVNDNIYAVYTDYESDYTGSYTLIIGLPVKNFDNVPEGLQEITINEDGFKKYISKGKMPAAILETWFEIWGDKELSRAYRTDFTVHGKKYFDGDNAEVETFISIND